ncbi:hypothetical protein [Micromonospora maritima]|uniref:phage tail tube protein n=1 Tax=Micromonospora maritima TaxID=986711 RepID=UPI00157D7C11|nr:hypothetical protein [Micromonospora maritima]
MATNTIAPGQIKTGPGIIRYAPLGTTIPTFTAATSKITGTWTNWLDVGATDEGMTYTESTDTSDITVAESLYPVRTVTTGKTGRVAFTMNHLSDLNWKLAMNGGTITTSGTGATKLNTYVPPLVGAEVRVMLAFQSLEDDEVIVWPQVFNVGSVEVARGTYETKAGLPCEFAVELPDPAVLTTPYKRWTSGPLAQGV